MSRALNEEIASGISRGCIINKTSFILKYSCAPSAICFLSHIISGESSLQKRLIPGTCHHTIEIILENIAYDVTCKTCPQFPIGSYDQRSGCMNKHPVTRVVSWSSGRSYNDRLPY